MKNYKKQVMLNEFNITTSKPQDLDSILVKRIDESLLNFIPRTYFWDGSMGCSESWDEIYIKFDGNYEKIDIENSLESGSNYAHSVTETKEGESLLEWFIRKDEQRVPKIILVYSKNYSSWGQWSDCDEYNLTIYKSAKDENLIADAIRKYKSAVASEVAAETSF